MIRLYIDKNVLSKLKLRDEEKFVLLETKLAEIKPYVSIVYSRAHISDLTNGYNAEDEIIREKTKEDLDLISNLTDNQCLISYLNESNPRGQIKNPEIWFKELIDDEQKEKSDPNNPFKELLEIGKGDNSPLGLKANTAVNALFNAPSPFLALGEAANNPLVKNLFGEGQTMGEAMTHMMNFVNDLKKNPKKFIEINKYAQDHLKLGSHISQTEKNVFQNLDKEMNKKHKTTLSKMLESVIQNQKPNEKITNWDKYLNAFSLLNTIGYKTDNLKNGYTNYQNDIEHSFMAAHCDYFITEDGKTYFKAKAANEKEGLLTKVCKVDEFIESINNLTFEIKDTSEFLDVIHDNCDIIEEGDRYCDISTRHEVQCGFLINNLFNYFNYLFIMTPEGKDSFYQFSRKDINYSNFIFNSEVGKLVNLISNAIGNDINDQGEFNEDDEKQLDDRAWKGRHWRLSKFFFSLGFKSGESNLIFTIMIISKEG